LGLHRRPARRAAAGRQRRYLPLQRAVEQGRAAFRPLPARAPRAATAGPALRARPEAKTPGVNAVNAAVGAAMAAIARSIAAMAAPTPPTTPAGQRCISPPPAGYALMRAIPRSRCP